MLSVYSFKQDKKSKQDKKRARGMLPLAGEFSLPVALPEEHVQRCDQFSYLLSRHTNLPVR